MTAIDKTYPAMQGVYDSFCSIYAVINFLRYKGQIQDDQAAYALFKFLLLRIDAEPDGSVALVATEGLDPAQLKWVAEKANLALKTDTIKKPKLSAGQAAIIYFEVLGDSASIENHYTVAVARADGGFDLVDSYDFSNLRMEAGAWKVTFDSTPPQDVRVNVTHIWRED